MTLECHLLPGAAPHNHHTSRSLCELPLAIENKPAAVSDLTALKVPVTLPPTLLVPLPRANEARRPENLRIKSRQQVSSRSAETARRIPEGDRRTRDSLPAGTKGAPCGVWPCHLQRSSTGTNTTHTGLGTRTECPVNTNLPVEVSTRNTATPSLF